MKKIYKYIHWLGYISSFGIILFLTFNKHSKSGYFNYHSEIWSDKAGYYIYLPAAIKFGFDPNNFPDSINVKTGHGFRLDYENKKVITKYTYGVALLQLPFFFLADVFASIINQKTDGFSPIYHWSIDVASVFYLILGLLFLFRYLKNQFKSGIIYLVLLTIFLTTNLYYYSVDETGMSHVYSFSLFCIYLFIIKKTNFLLTQFTVNYFIIGIIGGLIIIIRPSNLIFLLVYFFLDLESNNDILLRFKNILQPKIFLLTVLGVIIIISPQLVYWQYAYGSLISYTYSNEGFNWTDPKLLHTWFSPHNGLFLYNPIYLIIISSLVYMIFKQVKNGIVILIMFLVISYVFSSWWDWGFGCAFGARSYVEYLAIFSIPLAYIFQEIKQLGKIKWLVFYLGIIAITILNLKMIYSYDGCIGETNNWDWNAYIKLIESPTK